jgi:hypothetical protein
MAKQSEGQVVDAPISGAVPDLGPVAGAGVASLIRIPVPGPGNLAIELSPRNFNGRSTSTLFIQDPNGKALLRLDYGRNPRTNTYDYHWNQKGTFKTFGIEDHTPVGRAGVMLYRGARAFKYLGRGLVVIGATTDLISIAVASNPLRRSVQVVSAWALAWLTARAAGTVGAEIGTAVEPGLGTAVGGLVFAFAGGVAGYWAGETDAGAVYDWAADTRFDRLPEVPFNSNADRGGTSAIRAGAAGGY